MKKLIISMKSTEDMFSDFKKVASQVKKRHSSKNPHYEIAFGNQKDFNFFLRNLNLLSVILNSKPESIYELAKIADADFSKIKKVMAFFADTGVVKIKEKKKGRRLIKQPIVDYDKIEFNLKAA